MHVYCQQQHCVYRCVDLQLPSLFLEKVTANHHRGGGIQVTTITREVKIEVLKYYKN